MFFHISSFCRVTHIRLSSYILIASFKNKRKKLAKMNIFWDGILPIATKSYYLCVPDWPVSAINENRISDLRCKKTFGRKNISRLSGRRHRRNLTKRRIDSSTASMLSSSSCIYFFNAMTRTGERSVLSSRWSRFRTTENVLRVTVYNERAEWDEDEGWEGDEEQKCSLQSICANRKHLQAQPNNIYLWDCVWGNRNAKQNEIKKTQHVYASAADSEWLANQDEDEVGADRWVRWNIWIY